MYSWSWNQSTSSNRYLTESVAAKSGAAGGVTSQGLNIGAGLGSKIGVGISTALTSIEGIGFTSTLGVACLVPQCVKQQMTIQTIAAASNVIRQCFFRKSKIGEIELRMAVSCIKA